MAINGIWQVFSLPLYLRVVAILEPAQARVLVSWRFTEQRSLDAASKSHHTGR